MNLGVIKQIKAAYREKMCKMEMLSYLPASSNILKYKQRRGGEYLMNLFEVRNKNLEIKKEEALRREFLELLDRAKLDWQLSQKILSEITDVDLIDYVVYLVKANEARYRYLLKIAKKEKICYAAWQS